jgi:hypothetical protein
MTGRELIERAYLRAQLVARGQPLTAEEGSDGLKLLNEMLAAWETDGIHLGIGEQTLSGEVPLPRNHDRGIIMLLAMDMLDEFRRDPPAGLAAKADRAKRQLMTEYVQVPEAKFDQALTDFDANREPFDINQG